MYIPKLAAIQIGENKMKSARASGRRAQFSFVLS